MENLLLGILDSTLDYATVGKVILIYFISLWGMFSLWVFFDAKKRYENTLKAVVFFLLVFIFNFPALIFYIIVRPESEESHHEYSHGGLDIPVANFVDNNGNVELTLNIRLNASEVLPGSVRVNIEGDKVQSRSEMPNDSIVNILESDPADNKFHKIKSKAKVFSGKAVKASKNLIGEIKSYGDKIEKSDESTQNDKAESTEKNNSEKNK